MNTDKEEFVAYYKNHTRKETAAHFGISEGGVKSRAKRYECGKDIRKPRPDKNEFEQQYLIKTTPQLAQYYNVPERRIQHWAKTWNIYKPIKKVEKDELLSFYSHHTLEETADNFGMSVSYVVQLVRSYGFKKTPEMLHLSAVIPLPDDRPAFVEYFRTHSYSETATHYGVSKNTVARWRHELDIPDKVPEQWLQYRVVPCRSFDLPDKIEFEKIYNELSNEETAQYFSVSTATIDRWREELDVPRKANKWKDYAEHKLTDRQRSIVIGSLLGDGGLRSITDTSNSAFNEVHGEDQENYLRWKYKELLPFSSSFGKRVGNGKLRLPDGKVIEDTTRVSIGYALNTFAHPIFTSLEKQWYARDYFGDYVLDDKGWRIKVVPPDLELNDLIVAVWYFDDGSHNRNNGSGVVFNTQGFTWDECEILKSKLEQMGFAAQVNSNRGMPIIRLAASSYLQFMGMVSKHLPHESMSYKVDVSNYNFDKGPPARKLSRGDIEQVMRLLDDEEEDFVIAEKFGVKVPTIQDLRLGRSWVSITDGRTWSHSKTILSDDDIIKIRTTTDVPDKVWAKCYGVSEKHIQAIRLGYKRKLAGVVV